MIRTDGRRTVANAPVKPQSSYDRVVENAEAFIRTLDEIRALPEVKS